MMKKNNENYTPLQTPREIYRQFRKEEAMKKESEKERIRKRKKLKDSCIGIAIGLVNLSAILLLLFSKEAAMISFIVGIILPFVVGLVFCAWALAKKATYSVTKTIILTLLIIGAMVGGIYYFSNSKWGKDSRMEQIDSQRPDKY